MRENATPEVSGSAGACRLSKKAGRDKVATLRQPVALHEFNQSFFRKERMPSRIARSRLSAVVRRAKVDATKQSGSVCVCRLLDCRIAEPCHRAGLAGPVGSSQ
jgi:hypothetical protein